MAECLINSSMANPKFGICCYSGKISLPSLQPAPPELYDLLTCQDPDEKVFRLHIRNYNNALAMTSVGRKLDETYNQRGGGPYAFRLHEELIHRAGSLLPLEDDAVAPVYAQLYIYDSDVALRHHIANLWNARLNAATLGILQDMLYRCHPAVQLYKQAYELTRNMPSKQQCQIALHFDSSCDQHHYQCYDFPCSCLLYGE